MSLQRPIIVFDDVIRWVWWISPYFNYCLLSKLGLATRPIGLCMMLIHVFIVVSPYVRRVYPQNSRRFHQERILITGGTPKDSF
jgi:hypothetical protein